MSSASAGSYFKNLKNSAPISFILLAGFAVRMMFFWNDKVIAADGISYIKIARSIFHGDGFAAATHFPPFYPVLIGIFSLFIPDDEIAGKVVSTVMGGLTVIPVYLLGKELFSKKAGYIAALFVALSPTLIAISGRVLSQSTYIAVFMTALYLFWKSFDKYSLKMAAVAGLVFGVSYLTRPEAVIVFVGASLLFLLSRRSDRDRRGNLKLVLLAWSSFVILAFPYILMLHEVNGTWQLTGKSSVTLADSLGWYLNRPDLKREPGFSSLTYFDIITRYPDFLWKNPLKNIPAAWVELQGVFWLFASVGLAATLFSRQKMRELLYLATALLPVSIVIIFFWIDSHYFSPCLPILYLFAAEGLESLGAGLQWSFTRTKLAKIGTSVPWSFVIAAAIAIIPVFPGILANRSVPYDYTQDGARYDHKLIGQMLKKHLPPGARVMAKSGRICFYGDFTQVDIPQASLQEILKAAKAGNAHYLVADGTLFGARPQLEPFLGPLLVPQERVFATEPFDQVPDFPGGLKLILLYKDPASVGVAVYKL